MGEHTHTHGREQSSKQANKQARGLKKKKNRMCDSFHSFCIIPLKGLVSLIKKMFSLFLWMPMAVWRDTKKKEEKKSRAFWNNNSTQMLSDCKVATILFFFFLPHKMVDTNDTSGNVYNYRSSTGRQAGNTGDG